MAKKNSAPALKCNGYKLESWLAGHLEKGSVHWKGRSGIRMQGVVYTVRECTLVVYIFVII